MKVSYQLYQGVGDGIEFCEPTFSKLFPNVPASCVLHISTTKIIGWRVAELTYIQDNSDFNNPPFNTDNVKLRGHKKSFYLYSSTMYKIKANLGLVNPPAGTKLYFKFE